MAWASRTVLWPSSLTVCPWASVKPRVALWEPPNTAGFTSMAAASVWVVPVTITDSAIRSEYYSLFPKMKAVTAE